MIIAVNDGRFVNGHKKKRRLKSRLDFVGVDGLATALANARSA